MPAEDFVKNDKMRLILYREWQQKTDAKKTVQKINEKLVDNFITFAKVCYYYKRFNKGEIKLLSDGLHVSSFCPRNSSKIFIYLPFLMTSNNSHFNGSANTNDGRFLVLFYYCSDLRQYFLVIHDLFRGIEQKHVVSFKLKTGSSRPIIIGQYLLALGNCSKGQNKLHVLKINFDDLNIEEFKTVTVNFWLSSVILDQLNDGKFVVCDKNKITVGKIQDDGEIVMENAKELEKHTDMFGKRLFDNKFQGIIRKNTNKSFKFCEIDVETMKIKENDIDRPINETTNEFYYILPSKYCWSGDYFYVFYCVKNGYTLFMFDSINYKWTDLKVLATNPKTIFVDENQCLTLETGNTNIRKAYYRIALGKPDKLMNLVLLFGLRESKLYENNKYLNAYRQLNF